MYADPQSDVMAVIRSRRSEANDTNRNNWEYHEKVREHLIATNPDKVQNTAGFMKAAPQPFPVYVTPDIQERLPQLSPLFINPETMHPITNYSTMYQDKNKNVEAEKKEQTPETKRCQVA
jgi:hypothetical protein